MKIKISLCTVFCFTITTGFASPGCVRLFAEKGWQINEVGTSRFFSPVGPVQDQHDSINPGRDALWKIQHTKDFEITGNGSAPNWSNTSWLTLPQRNSNTRNAYQTRMKILYSDSGIYCLYHCEDRKITATLNEDFSDLYKEDVVEAFFWTDEKVPIYFEYELSPNNYELAILVPNIKGRFWGWRPWHYEGNRKTRHATHISKEGENIEVWTAEFFIPYALLMPLTNVPPQKGTRWRANFYRIDYDVGETTWQWQLVKDEDFHDYERFGTIVFE